MPPIAAVLCSILLSAALTLPFSCYSFFLASPAYCLVEQSETLDCVPSIVINKRLLIACKSGLNVRMTRATMGAHTSQ